MRWFVPLVGVIKINFDGAIFKPDGCSNVGVVIRNHNGDFLVGLCQKIVGCLSAENVEALAASVAVK
ncbi:unnamed protein product [Ilex paraguariensis]|uniref:RNase H type-1 domain-containing protein n=1 Tax=Ilex paraguariensis TaxID=185542 RepID=A0ABC8UHN7_9AQUA